MSLVSSVATHRQVPFTHGFFEKLASEQFDLNLKGELLAQSVFLKDLELNKVYPILSNYIQLYPIISI